MSTATRRPVRDEDLSVASELALAALTIGAVSKQLEREFPDISISKVRYLEDQKLLSPRRTPGGYRLYAPADVDRLRTILRLQRDEFWPGARQGLTQRESEILSLVVNGLSNKGIANKLVIGDETVKTHLRSVYRKLGVSDRTGAVATALREGIYQ